MITAVDTNILIDILEPDPDFGPSSRESLRKCMKEGAVVVCEVVLAEVATAYGDAGEEAIKALHDIGLDFLPMNEEAVLKSAECWHIYRMKSKAAARNRIVADFLIGGHALVQADCLLTRDRGFYKEYFKKLKII